MIWYAQYDFYQMMHGTCRGFILIMYWQALFSHRNPIHWLADCGHGPGQLTKSMYQRRSFYLNAQGSFLDHFSLPVCCWLYIWVFLMWFAATICCAQSLKLSPHPVSIIGSTIIPPFRKQLARHVSAFHTRSLFATRCCTEGCSNIAKKASRKSFWLVGGGFSFVLRWEPGQRPEITSIDMSVLTWANFRVFPRLVASDFRRKQQMERSI